MILRVNLLTFFSCRSSFSKSRDISVLIVVEFSNKLATYQCKSRCLEALCARKFFSLLLRAEYDSCVVIESFKRQRSAFRVRTVWERARDKN